MKARRFRWVKRALALSFVLALLTLLVGLPLGGSFLITNSRFSFPEPGPTDPAALGLEVTDVRFQAEDGTRIEGWWNRGETGRPVVVFVHGLNRSRLELLERAAETRQRGYGVLLIDLRNHGASDPAYTTLGVAESMDVCAAERFVAGRAGTGRPIVLWGVSLGASTALLSANRCPGAAAVVADSAFLSLDETVSHHIELFTPLPSFPIANLLTAVTRFRMKFSRDDGDVERSVATHPDLPVLFIAGSQDERMPPDLARRLRAASPHPLSEFLVIDGARHGRAFEQAPVQYLAAVFSFLDKVLAAPPR
jgi:pimeloyl-ACP methyl ester carboxylesterase